ncbi:Hypothetical predicted protein [Octopus vulgaris]|uniref:Uncharacterized protein n=1 Tax=Octopus vulgaris TaxID=6645 RepID=A0AA36EWZ7_OCTVU|nr:Hypothetical predicted protein [Octopus vulgaris]
MEGIIIAGGRLANKQQRNSLSNAIVCDKANFNFEELKVKEIGGETFQVLQLVRFPNVIKYLNPRFVYGFRIGKICSKPGAIISLIC